MTRQFLSFCFPFLCLLASLLFPEQAREGVSLGLRLSLERALPALFPALVLSRFLPAFWPAKKGRGVLLLPLFAGIFCGFPVGSIVVRDMVEKNLLTKKEGERSLIFAGNAGPAFLLSYCGQILRNQTAAQYLFLVQSALAILLFLIFFGFRKKEVPEAMQTPTTLPEALRSATDSFLYIMACVIFFSFLSQLLCPAVPHLSLFFELTGGVASLASLPFSSAFPLCALGCGWGGLSVLLQTAGVLRGRLRLRFYVAGRVLFAVVLLLSTLFFPKVL